MQAAMVTDTLLWHKVGDPVLELTNKNAPVCEVCPITHVLLLWISSKVSHGE